MNALLDTGPWVALLDRSESAHEATVAWFRNFNGKLYSTEAVITKVLYLLNFSIQAQSAAMEFVTQLVVELIPPSVGSVTKSQKLMQKYADLPMDYADATLVVLAEETHIYNVVTLDKKDFSIYRLSKNKKFTIINE